MPTLAELIVRVGANISGLERGFGAAQKEIDFLVRKTKPLAEDFTRVGSAVTAAGTAIGLGLGHAVSVAADFEAAMSDVQSVSDASAAEMAQLQGKALEMGASTKYSALEAAGGMGELLKAGVSTTDVITGGLAGALSLAAAGDLSVAEAATVASKAMNVFNLDGAQTTHVADLLAAAANKSATDVHNMGAAFNQSASVAANLKIPVETLTGTLAMFAQRGLEGSDAGTSFKTMLMRLNPQSAEAAAMMDKLGLSFFDAQGQFIGIGAMAQQLRTQLGGLTDEQRQAALATIFGSDAIRAATELYKAGGGGIAEWTGKVDDSGAAARIAAAKQDNLKGALEQLGGAFETAEISIGSKLIPGIRSLTESVSGAVDWFNKLPASMQESIAVGSTLTAGFGLLSGGMLLIIGQIPNMIQGLAAVRTAFVTLGLTLNTLIPAFAAAALAIEALRWWEARKAAEAFNAELGRPVIQTTVANLDKLRGSVEASIGPILAAQAAFKGAAGEAENLSAAAGKVDWTVRAQSEALKLNATAATEAQREWVDFTGVSTSSGAAHRSTVAGMRSAVADLAGAHRGAFGAMSQDVDQHVQSWDRLIRLGPRVAAVEIKSFGQQAISALDGARASSDALGASLAATTQRVIGLGGHLDLGLGFKGLQGTIIGVGGLGTYNGGGQPPPGVPGAATGGDVLRGGTTLVGENGPELLNLPKGARVAPLPAGAGGGTVVNNYYTITVEGSVVGEDEIWRLARRGGIRHRRSNPSAALA